MVFEEIGNAALDSGNALYEGAKKIGQGTVKAGKAIAKGLGKATKYAKEGIGRLYEAARTNIPRLGSTIQTYANQAKEAIIPQLQGLYQKGRSYYQQGRQALGSWLQEYLAALALAAEQKRAQQSTPLTGAEEAMPMQQPMNNAQPAAESTMGPMMTPMGVAANTGLPLNQALAEIALSNPRIISPTPLVQQPFARQPAFMGPAPMPEEPQSVFLVDNRDDTVTTVLGEFRTMQEAEAEVAKLRKQGLPAYYATKGYIDNLRLRA